MHFIEKQEHLRMSFGQELFFNLGIFLRKHFRVGLTHFDQLCVEGFVVNLSKPFAGKEYTKQQDKIKCVYEIQHLDSSVALCLARWLNEQKFVF